MDIDDFNIINKLYIWLYSGRNLFPFNDLIKWSNQCFVPSNIVLWKIIVTLFNDTVTDRTKEQKIDEIANKIIDLKIIQNLNLDQLKNIIDKLVELKSFGTRSLNGEIMDIIGVLADKIMINEKTHKSDYPEPDIDRGRPYINWHECYYEDCHEKFGSSNDLVKHLIKAGKYTFRFHTEHEDAINRLKLTPESVKDKKLKYCPSYVCDKSDVEFEPEELINHFKELGLTPFWQPGMKIKTKEEMFKLVDDKCYDKIYLSDECGICLENPASAIILPCYHNITCLQCVVNCNRCPLCRGSISRIIPF